jgi:hypothetical protein
MLSGNDGAQDGSGGDLHSMMIDYEGFLGLGDMEVNQDGYLL